MQMKTYADEGEGRWIRRVANEDRRIKGFRRIISRVELAVDANC